MSSQETCMRNKTHNLYEFDEFRIDEKERILLAGGKVIQLPPKVFDTLFSIVKRQGSIVSKDELMNEVWTDSFVEEGNLTQNIYTLRQTLGKEYIETVPRRGYRFAKKVNLTSLGENVTTSDPNPVEISTNSSKQKAFQKETSEISQHKPFLTLGKLQAGLITGLVAIVLGSFVFWGIKNGESKLKKTSLENIEFLRLTNSGDVLGMAISPTGKLLAYVSGDESAQKTVSLLDIQSEQSVKLNIPSKVNFSAVRFSNDGDLLYFLDRKGNNQAGKVYQITRFGGVPKLIADDVWSKFSVSPNGKMLAFFRRNPKTNEHRLIIRSVESEKTEQVISKRSFPDGFSLITQPTWFPAGNKILVNVQPQKKHSSKLTIVDLDSGEERSLKTPRLRRVITTEIAPDGDTVFIAAREKGKFSQIFRFTISTGKLSRITNDLNNYRPLSLSSDGKSLVVIKVSSFSHLWHYPSLDLTKARQLTFGQSARDGRHGFELLPGGKLAYLSLADNNRDIWVIDQDGKSKRQFTENLSDANEHPSVSRDGSKIYFDSIGKKTRKIMSIGAKGENLTDIVTDENHNFLHPAISPDDKTLYFIRQSKGFSTIWRKNLESGKQEKLPISEKIAPQRFLKLSPDGKKLAFQQATKKQTERSKEDSIKTIQVGIISLEDISADPIFLTIPTDSPVIRWTKTSDAFDFIENKTKGAKIWRQNILEKEKRELLFDLPNRLLFNFVWSLDGKDLFVSQGKKDFDAVLIKNF